MTEREKEREREREREKEREREGRMLFYTYQILLYTIMMHVYTGC